MPKPDHGALRLTLLKRSILDRVVGTPKIEGREIATWLRAGRPAPAPSFVKRIILAQYFAQFGLTAAVETGTFLGDTTEFLSTFGRVDTIEIQPDLYRAACERFAGRVNIRVHQGDSGALLPRILDEVGQAALLWLDGHYSGGFTGSGKEHSPVVSEVHAAGRSRHARSHVILIDDARLFTGRDGYPTIDELRQIVHGYGYDRLYVADDIIRIHSLGRSDLA